MDKMLIFIYLLHSFMLLIHFRISEVSKGIANEKLMDRNEEKFVNRRVFADSKSP